MSVCRECGLAITFRMKDGVCIPIHGSGKWCQGPVERTRAITCPKCHQIAYYVQHNGGFAWFDELGPPWPKHPCFDLVTPQGHVHPAQPSQPVAARVYDVKSPPVRGDQRRTLCGVCEKIFSGSYADHLKTGHLPSLSNSKGTSQHPTGGVDHTMAAKSKPPDDPTDGRNRPIVLRIDAPKSNTPLTQPMDTRQACDCGGDTSCVMCEGSGWFIEHYDGDFTPGSSA